MEKRQDFKQKILHQYTTHIHLYRTGSTKIFLLTLTDSHNAKSLPRQSNSLEVNEVVFQRISYNAPFSLGASLPVRQRQQLGEALSLQTGSPPCFTFSFIMMIFVLEQFAFDITSFLLHPYYPTPTLLLRAGRKFPVSVF